MSKAGPKRGQGLARPGLRPDEASPGAGYTFNFSLFNGEQTSDSKWIRINLIAMCMTFSLLMIAYMRVLICYDVS